MREGSRWNPKGREGCRGRSGNIHIAMSEKPLPRLKCPRTDEIEQFIAEPSLLHEMHDMYLIHSACKLLSLRILRRLGRFVDLKQLHLERHLAVCMCTMPNEVKPCAIQFLMPRLVRCIMGDYHAASLHNAIVLVTNILFHG